MNRQKLVLLLCMLIAIFSSCKKDDKIMQNNGLNGDTWAEKLGWPKDKIVLILHADDIGMCAEANTAAKTMLGNNQIQSAAMMAPCAYFDEFAAWYKQHPEKDIGMHLTLTSEWQTWRWGPVSDPATVPGLLDAEGKLWRDVLPVAARATAAEVETEIRAQIEKALAFGVKPGHIDTHMGTLYAKYDFTAAYLKVAEEYGIPAMAIDMQEDVAEKFRAQRYPITDALIQLIQDYSLPKLDDFHSVGGGATYEEKRQKFFDQVKSMQPGLQEIIFHPSVESENLKTITNSWQQRVWESQMFADPVVQQFFLDQGIIFTNWKEIMQRFRDRGGAAAE